jgi:hypothetical protein
MPIRFRCSHCHQLLGIARRKSGQLVHCPTCNASLLVPATDELPAMPDELRPSSDPAAPAAAPADPPGLFERDDFDALLRFSVSGPVEPRKSAAGSVHTPPPATRNPPVESAPPPPLPMPQAFNVEPFPVARTQAALTTPGIILSPGRATVLTVVVILLLAVAFGAGLIVGRYCL